MDVGGILFAGSIGLIVIGVSGIVMAHHVVRIILALGLLEAGANLLLVLVGFRWNAAAPIIVDGVVPDAMVDPVPQALVLTAIVIGVGVQALALTVALRLKRAYGTLDIRDLRQEMEKDIAREAGIELPTSADAPTRVEPLAPTYQDRFPGAKPKQG